jgi:hypothetical protein
MKEIVPSSKFWKNACTPAGSPFHFDQHIDYGHSKHAEHLRIRYT